MKKFLLFIGLTAFTFGAFAEKVPSVIVNKSQGGWQAILNMYNYVIYTPASVNNNGVGQLDCVGAGYSACRVPNCNSLNVYDGNTLSPVTEAGKLQAFVTAINDVINQFEAAHEQYLSAPTSNGGTKAMPSVFTKTISLANNSTGPGLKKNNTYVVRGEVTKLNGNNSTLKIYIEKVNLNMLSGNN
jgi:hypothetical protein